MVFDFGRAAAPWILIGLFGSNSVIFMVIGSVIAAIIGLRPKHQKSVPWMAIAISIAVYAVCEIVSGLHTNFMLELMLLFFGTVSMGCCLGFIACVLFHSRKSKKDQQ